MSTLSAPLKRVKRKIKKSQNPLFEKWLKEWKDDASKNGSEMQYCFNRALKSLQKFPFELRRGKDCIILENFGSKICNMLDKKLEEHKVTHQKEDDINQECIIRNNSHQTNTKKRKSSGIMVKNKKVPESNSDSGTVVAENGDYCPKYKSGGYAILIAMFEKSQEDNFKSLLTKFEIQESAQKYCSSSFTIPQSGSSYTAWSAMSLLIKKNLVSKTGNPAKFSLTETGTDVAIKLKFNYNSVRNSPSKEFNLVSEDEIPTEPNVSKPTREKHLEMEDSQKNKQSKVNFVSCISESTQSNFIKPLEWKEKKTEFHNGVNETIFMVPNSFSIVLLVDIQERDNKFQQADQMTMRQLKSRHVNFEIRHLKVGDFIWVARNRSGQELVLPYVVERKRMDDLASSIKDGRFHEQKFRLKQSGLENLIYLVEKFGNENQRLGLPLPTLMQAISNTQILGEFNVKVTNNHNHSMRYLDCMTTQLNDIFKNKTLMSCQKSNLTSVNLSDDLISLMTFEDFNKGSEKNKKPTVKNMLVKHLLQLNGVSVEKAKAIVQLYPTPKALMRALKEPDGDKSIEYKVLSHIGEGSFSEVLKCQERETGSLYAAKRLKKDYQSLAEVTESPEVIAMRKLSHHPNILHIIEFHVDPIPGKVTFIFELMDMSLYDMMKNRKRPLPEIRVKKYLYQLLKGLDHLHHHGIFHRDIKPENILIKNEVIKLADLGSIRGAYSRPPYTEYISTRWYRSPECLLTTGYYGPKMDVWACGCVFYELLTTKPLFPGTNEVDQITKIHDILGTPNTRLLARFYRHKSRNCEYFFQNRTGSGLVCLLPNLTENGRDILKQMLTYDPDHRTNVRRLLEHRYFNELRDLEPIPVKKTASVSHTLTKEWRNPLLLSLITSGEKKKKTKLLKKRSSPQKIIKQNASVSTQSLSAAVNFISGSTGSKTLPLLYNGSGQHEKMSGPALSKFDSATSRKVDKMVRGSEERIAIRSWVAERSNSKISHPEVKSESTRPMKRKPSPQLPKMSKNLAQKSPANASFPTYESPPRDFFDFGSVTLPNIDVRRSDHIVQRRLHQMNFSSGFSPNKVSILSTIPERGKTHGIRGESPADSSSTEGIIKKPRGI